LLSCEGVWERALENFWQMSARLYGEVNAETDSRSTDTVNFCNERAVNRSRRQKFSAREQNPEAKYIKERNL